MKDVKFEWKNECHITLDRLKKNMVTTPILVFSNWTKEFHVHVDSSLVALGVILSQLGEGSTNHLISFASQKLSTV